MQSFKSSVSFNIYYMSEKSKPFLIEWAAKYLNKDKFLYEVDTIFLYVCV